MFMLTSKKWQICIDCASSWTGLKMIYSQQQDLIENKTNCRSGTQPLADSFVRGYCYIKFKKVLLKTFTPNPHLEMLMQREQLMEDIDSIVDGELSGIISQELSDELVRRLCDAVCKNFPAK